MNQFKVNMQPFFVNMQPFFVNMQPFFLHWLWLNEKLLVDRVFHTLCNQKWKNPAKKEKYNQTVKYVKWQHW